VLWKQSEEGNWCKSNTAPATVSEECYYDWALFLIKSDTTGFTYPKLDKKLGRHNNAVIRKSGDLL
jgi:hypothetical protein